MGDMKSSVMVFGTFDVFHLGHKFFIEEAMKKGSGLMIVVARDITVQRLKGYLRYPEAVRVSVLEREFPEARVVLGDLVDYMKVVRDFMPGVVCLGYDQRSFCEQLEKEFPTLKVCRLAAYKPEIYKSSKIKRGESGCC